MRKSKWFLLMVLCVAIWAALILCLSSLIVRAEGESGDWPTPEEIAEEEYYDSLELLAVCVEAEAGNQSLDGKRLVVDVILNRVDDPDFPDTITEVISEPYAFTSYWDGGMASIWSPSDETFEAVRMELETRSWPGVLYFTAGDYGKYGTPWKQVGDHYFSTK